LKSPRMSGNPVFDMLPFFFIDFVCFLFFGDGCINGIP